jgi:hypothetical protein
MPRPSINEALAFLRANSRGELRCDERLQRIKFVFAADGAMAAPAARGTIESVDTVLFIPEYREDVMEVQCSLSPLQSTGSDAAVQDRWRIYFGAPSEPEWVRLTPDAARYRGMVIDGEALMQRNSLAAEEAALCRFVNQSHVESLRRVIARATRVHVELPVMVGIDENGIDVRASFGVIRLAFSKPMATALDAKAAIGRLLAPESAEEDVRS